MFQERSAGGADSSELGRPAGVRTAPAGTGAVPPGCRSTEVAGVHGDTPCEPRIVTEIAERRTIAAWAQPEGTRP